MSHHAPATYPLVLTNLSSVRCVVVGGGNVAERKVCDLVAGGARPIVIAPALTEALHTLLAAGRIEHHARAYRDGDLRQAWLAVAATDEREVNAAVAREGQARGILVNIADDPAEGNFHTMATVRRGDLLLAISTGGGSPSLTAHMRRQLEAQYGPEYGRLLTLMAKVRPVARAILAREQQMQLWQYAMSEPIMNLLRSEQYREAERCLLDELDRLRAQ